MSRDTGHVESSTNESRLSSHIGMSQKKRYGKETEHVMWCIYSWQAEQAEQKRWHEERDPDEAFTGSLDGQKKVGLQDIVYSLHLDIEGIVKDLKSRINTFFEEYGELHTNPRYIGLFPQLAQRNRQAVQLAPTYTPAPLN